VDATTYGAKMPRANWEAVGNLMMLLPPLEEQKEIVGHIRNNVSRIEAVSGHVQDAIDRLKEYRTALITNAVTGKIKVV
jgi:type I restriction enzyme S subunit